MENTLLVGDFLFVNKALCGRVPPHKRLRRSGSPAGSILVFDSEENIDVVKRLIGMPGDTLAMADGQLLRNGKVLDEPWVVHANPMPQATPLQRAQMRQWQVKHLAGPDTAGYNPDLQDWGPIVVPPDSFFMMGDSRDNSHDSRMWGFLPRTNVRGRPMFVYYSFDPQHWRPLPFLTAIRWDRILSRPR
jgi:signal peptidase I